MNLALKPFIYLMDKQIASDDTIEIHPCWQEIVPKSTFNPLKTLTRQSETGKQQATEIWEYLKPQI